MASDNTPLSTVPPSSSSGSWLVDMILYFDRPSSTAVGRPRSFDKLPRYDSTTTATSNSSSNVNIDDKHAGQDETCLYLAYGSNLSAATFQGNRGLKPLSAINVLVPSLRFTWDLPGIPYAEPCYANARQRSYEGQILEIEEDNNKLTSSSSSTSSCSSGEITRDDVEGWQKPLVGVVYELTRADYAHILRTEGQGYKPLEISCLALDEEQHHVAVPDRRIPSFKAHAVLSCLSKPSAADATEPRPRHRNLQPSSRYLNILLAGAHEHGLPTEYKTWLSSVATYTPTSTRQRLGKSIFSAVWFVPVLLAILLERNMADRNGVIPEWVNKIVDKCFDGMWWSHDWVFEPVFGSGEHK